MSFGVKCFQMYSLSVSIFLLIIPSVLSSSLTRIETSCECDMRYTRTVYYYYYWLRLLFNPYTRLHCTILRLRRFSFLRSLRVNGVVLFVPYLSTRDTLDGRMKASGLSPRPLSLLKINPNPPTPSRFSSLPCLLCRRFRKTRSGVQFVH